eukprot:5332818-Pyramimonas_sp.AAC.2
MNGSLEQWLQRERDVIAGGPQDALRLLFMDFETFMSDSGLHGEKPGFDCFTVSALGLERLNVNTTFPCMSSRVKAARMKHIVYYLANVASSMRADTLEETSSTFTSSSSSILSHRPPSSSHSRSLRPHHRFKSPPLPSSRAACEATAPGRRKPIQ